ncbi:MAG: hypothetical protein MUO76_11995 [Anaerolineaceae bacterium]|nr:hypothetical protein [Anaerolineaceae bacterium]
MSESIQRIIKRRALDGQHPTHPEEIITWLEAVAQAWNRHPTPFMWGGKRAARRVRSHQLHALSGSGAFTHYPVQRQRCTIIEKWQRSCQMTR